MAAWHTTSTRSPAQQTHSAPTIKMAFAEKQEPARAATSTANQVFAVYHSAATTVTRESAHLEYVRAAPTTTTPIRAHKISSASTITTTVFVPARV